MTIAEMRKNTFIIIIMTMVGLGGRVVSFSPSMRSPTMAMALLGLTGLTGLVSGGVRDEVKALAGSSVSLRCAVNR